ncbi:MAG: selenide, water dikinase SelD [Anaerolineales bacterium]|nr:selenide, water dikinase SelD [Anaerolineales bacterium]
MRPIEGIFPSQDYPDLLVGLDQPDDAAVWRIDDTRSLVVTTDFFTPVVDDPYDYGAIAAANSLSDIYAMGGTPFMALNVAALPPDLPPEISGQILLGGAEKAKEAGVVVAGGHTIQDKEPKYGLIVVGFADPNQTMTKGGARPGDLLVLTKPLGFGTTTTAIKQAKAAQSDIDEVVAWMKKLNREGAQLGLDFGVRGATDITGFSLLGHAWELASASGVGLRFDFANIPFTAGAFKYASDFIFPGGASDNRLYYEPHVHFLRDLPESARLLLFDPQTSGGLLMAVPSGKLGALISRADNLGQPLWVVGEVVAGDHIEVV